LNNFTSILEGRNLKIQIGNTVILDVPEIRIQAGEFLSVIGHNGAGKTTLLKMLCCLMKKPKEGEILFKDRTIGSECSLMEYRRKVTMVFQEPLLFDTTVYNNVASGLKFHGIEHSDINAIVMENLERFGISHLKGRSAWTLSSGEARKTSLARALALKPEILFLDEPFASLDPLAKDILYSDLERVLPKSGLTVVFATHDYGDVLRLSHRVAVMENGKIIQIEDPDTVLKHPANSFVSSFYRLNRT
jgi:tungstate transport system ATP-binding protein